MLRTMPRLKPDYIAILIALTLFIGSTWRVAFTPGYVFLAEQFEVLDAASFLNIALQLWPKFQIFSDADPQKLYLYMFLYVVSIGNYKLLQLLALGLPSALAYLSAYLLARELGRDYRSALAASFIYILNPLFINQPRDIQYRFDYAAAPLIAYLFIRILKTRTYRSALVFSIAYAFFLDPRSALIYALISIPIYVIHIILTRKLLLKLLMFIIVTITILSLPKILPVVYHIIIHSSTAIAGSELVSSNRVPMYKALMLYFAPYPAYAYDFIFIDNRVYGFFIATLLALLSLIKYRKHTIARTLGAIYIALGVLLTNSQVNIDSLIDTSDALHRLLRHSYWNGIITATGYVVLLASSRRLALASAIVAMFIIGPVFFSGDMNGYWFPSISPDIYTELGRYVNGTILWYPLTDAKAIWHNAKSPFDGMPPTGEIEIRTSPYSAYSLVQAQTAWLYFGYFNYFDSGLPSNMVSIDPRIAYGNIGISYVGVRHDYNFSRYWSNLGYTNERLVSLASHLAQYGRLVYNSSAASIIYLGEAPECRAGDFLVATGGMPSLAVMYDLYGNMTPPIVFLPDSEGLKPPAYIIQGDDDIIQIRGIVVKASSLKREGYKVSADATFANAFIDTLGWKFSYDITGGYIFALSPARAWGSVEIPRGNYSIYIRAYICPMCGNITIYINKIAYEVNLKADISRFLWLEIGEITTSGGPLEIEVRGSGITAFSHLAFASGIVKADGIRIYTPYDIPGALVKMRESPLGVAVWSNATIKVPIEGERIIRAKILSGHVLLNGTLLTDGALVKGEVAEIRFVNASVSYIALIPPNIKLNVVPSNCTGNHTKSFLQYNAGFDRTWVLKCDDKTIRPVRVYGIVNGYYIPEPLQNCRLEFEPYTVRNIAIAISGVYLLGIVGVIGISHFKLPNITSRIQLFIRAIWRPYS